MNRLVCILSCSFISLSAFAKTETIEFHVASVCILKDNSQGNKMRIEGHAPIVPVIGNPPVNQMISKTAPVMTHFPHSLLIKQNRIRVVGQTDDGVERIFLFAPFKMEINSSFQLEQEIRFWGYGQETAQKIALCQ